MVSKPLLPLGGASVGYPCSNYFFQKERLCTRRDGADRNRLLPSAYAYWQSPQGHKTVSDYVKRSGRNLFSAVVFLGRAPAQFPILTAAKMYLYFNADHVFDPYAGWGDRCVAAIAAGVTYTGCDSNTKLRVPYRRMINTLGDPSKHTVYIRKSESLDLDQVSYDLIFTSPPYFNNGCLTEVYKNCETSYERFLERSLIPIVNHGLERGVPVCLHLPENMYKDLRKVFGKASKIFKMSKCNQSGKRVDKIYCWLP